MRWIGWRTIWDMWHERRISDVGSVRGWALLNFIRNAPLPPTSAELYADWLEKKTGSDLDWHGGEPSWWSVYDTGGW